MQTQISSLTIARPDDWHVHFRDGAALRSVVGHTARRFARALVMPNLKPPVTSVEAAREYRTRIVDAVTAHPGLLQAGAGFTPLMSLYLTDNTAPQEIALAKQSGFVHAVKYYPAGATTHSDAGITRLERVYPALEAMQRHDLPLLVHGEVADAEVDIYDREAVFIDTVLSQILRRFPGLRVVFEHITTREAVQFVQGAGAKLGATITAHHLLYNRNAIFQGGIRPHYYCLPVLKREEHRSVLLAAATGGDPKFFLGTDSAPHARGTKETACGCAGVYTAHAALELYAEVFDGAGVLDRLEPFAAFHGADFYGLSRNVEKVRLERSAWKVPDAYPFADASLVPLRAGDSVAWKLV
ncbi:MAG: dihydroorotase [Betaproteobacteria bacterium RIFCSPLOWO2_12_FULL_63_13]|nr:MAG: dihydroorotase [Betaproteobacteria bacterium RIFCSPLOWO2_02_FULL_63_19]OGA48674.1 MAG: dihydroorotase [Betaproteobacteria bacterium RIFCSPLOWO2_12_FULL_63_13]